MTKPNESAYPHLDESCQRVDETEHAPGLTKREYFAAMAMQGLLVGASVGCAGSEPEDIARDACKTADALIAELNK